MQKIVADAALMLVWLRGGTHLLLIDAPSALYLRRATAIYALHGRPRDAARAAPAPGSR